MSMYFISWRILDLEWGIEQLFLSNWSISLSKGKKIFFFKLINSDRAHDRIIFERILKILFKKI